MRGDLSAPVLAIIVTIGIIAAGLVLLAWFWWFAPQAGKTGALQIIGQPAVICNQTGSTVVISVKNTGSEKVIVTYIYVGNLTYSVSEDLNPGDSASIYASGDTCPTTWQYSVNGVISTTAGTYSTSFTVIRG
jgi:hypothetical protein